MRLGCITALGAALAIAGAAAAQPAPAHDTVVETRLLPRAVKTSVQRLAVASAGALSVADSLAAARHMIDAGRITGDPRTLGYAESLLARWPTEDARTPLDVLVLRATIEQRRHRFDAATSLLDRVIERAPDHGQALLTRAAIAQVRGELAAAAADCQRLRPLNTDVAAICGALNDALTGRNERALATLRIATARTLGPVRAWALGVQAQVHEQRGERSMAADTYRAALTAGDDLTLRLAFADLLIAERAWNEVRALLADAPPADGVLLRRWQVERGDGARDRAAELEAQLEARFDEASARGELLHAREAAVFALERGDAAAALRLAQENWRAQREPADLLVLARAARSGRDAAVLEDVRGWVRRTGLADTRLGFVMVGRR
jgi:Tfp pilus assembly protein PilF